MGTLLMGFSICSLCYAIFFEARIAPDVADALLADSFNSPAEMQQTSGVASEQAINTYAIAASFAIVGLICLVTAWKKRPS